jgi:hypothetical protein
VKRNPFHVLALPTDATTADIVDRGEELTELARTDEERHAAIEAQRELITHPATRLLHEVLEVPDASYRERDRAAFERRNKRNPVDLTALAAGANPLRRTDFNVHAVIGFLLDDLLRPPPVDVRRAVENPPVPPEVGAPPIEVRDVLFG